MRTLIVTLLLLAVAMSNECQKAVEYYKKHTLASKEDALVYYVNRAEIDKASNPIEAIQDFKYIQKTYGLTLQTLEAKGFNDEIVCIIKPSFDMPEVSYAEVKSAVANLDIEFSSTSSLNAMVNKAESFYPILKKHNLPLVKELFPYETSKYFEISGVENSKNVSYYLKIIDYRLGYTRLLIQAYEVIGNKVIPTGINTGDNFDRYSFCYDYGADYKMKMLTQQCKDNEECIAKHSQTIQDIENFICEKKETQADDTY